MVVDVLGIMISCHQFQLGFAVHVHDNLTEFYKTFIMTVPVYVLLFVLTCVFVHACILFGIRSTCESMKRKLYKYGIIIVSEYN